MEPDAGGQHAAAPGSPRAHQSPRAKCSVRCPLASLPRQPLHGPCRKPISGHCRYHDKIVFASQYSFRSRRCTALRDDLFGWLVLARGHPSDRLHIVRGMTNTRRICRWKPESALYAGIGSQHGLRDGRSVRSARAGCEVGPQVVSSCRSKRYSGRVPGWRDSERGRCVRKHKALRMSNRIHH